MKSLLCLLLVLMPLNQQINPSLPVFDDTVCEKCRCYRVNCNRLDKPGDSCFDSYKDTCDYPINIVEENDCNVKCDCCLEGQCFHSSAYECIFFRSLAFFSVLYLFATIINYFLFTKMYDSYFLVKRLYRKANFSDRIMKGEKNGFKFKRKFGLWIIREPDTHLQDRWETVKILFDSVEGLIMNARINCSVLGFMFVFYLTLISINLYIWFALVERPFAYMRMAWVQHSLHIVFYLTLISINLYIWFALVERPFAYMRMAWVQHSLHIVFYLSYLFCHFFFKRYAKELNKKLTEFEEYKGCKVRVYLRQNKFIINWDPVIEQAEDEKEKLIKNEEDGKSDIIDIEKEELQKNVSEEEQIEEAKEELQKKASKEEQIESSTVS